MNRFRWLPSLLTLSNLMLGAVSIIFSIEGDFRGAAVAILVAVIFDGLDGRIARLLHATSDFGKELDSLADIVSFGMAPAAAAYGAGLKELGILGWLLVILIPVAGALRLARFNLGTATGYFTGLPITATGAVIASLLISPVNLPVQGWGILMVLLAALMVSQIRYPDLKRLNVRDARLRKLSPLMAIAVAVALVNPMKLIFLPFAMYILYGIKAWGLSLVRTMTRHHKQASISEHASNSPVQESAAFVRR